jgi:hypothetical protein
MKVDPELEQTLKRAPQDNAAVIVHVQGDPAQYTSAIEALDLSVARVFRLTNTLAVRGPAFRVLELQDRPWVYKIEDDQKITTQRENDQR